MSPEGRTIRLVLAYEGTGYAGWQLQKDRPTVQGAVEAALARLTGEKIRVQAAGRTDSGVHALGQVAGFKTFARLSVREFKEALNSLLPEDIRVVQAAQARPDFHPRYQARRKCYRYHVWPGRRPPLFARRYVWALARRLDPARLQAAMTVLVGEKDFASFQSVGSEVRTTVRTIHRAEIQEQNGLLTFVFEADGFLRHMARALVGTLVGLPEPERLEAIIESRNRAEAGVTAPARGLFLAWVLYPEQERPVFAPGPFDLATVKEFRCAV